IGCTDLGLVDRRGRTLDRFHRPEEEVQARAGQFRLGRAEAQLDADFLRIDRIDRIDAPEGQERDNAADYGPTAAGYAAAKLIAAPIENVFEIGSISTGTARAAATSTGCLAPGAASIAAASASIILPRHLVPFGSCIF